MVTGKLQAVPDNSQKARDGHKRREATDEAGNDQPTVLVLVDEHQKAHAHRDRYETQRQEDQI